METIQPDTYNISCKDNIDRGGAHNLWYEFMHEIKNGEREISLEEFQMNLDASAILVKDRPMNDHRNVVWNALYQQFTHNPAKTAEKMPWVGTWLAQNIPMDKELGKQLKRPAHKIKLSHDFKKKFEKRLDKSAWNMKSAEVLELIQKDNHERLNNIHKAEKEVNQGKVSKSSFDSQDSVALSMLSQVKTIAPQEHVSALENTFGGMKFAVREQQKNRHEARCIIEQQTPNTEKPSVPPIIIRHVTEQNQEKANMTSITFDAQSLDQQQIDNAVKAIVTMGVTLSKDTHRKTFTITAGGDKNLAIAICAELEKHHLSGKLKESEFTAEEQQEILAAVKEKLYARSPARITHAYALQTVPSAKPEESNEEVLTIHNQSPPTIKP
jgi:hypothetical protein